MEMGKYSEDLPPSLKGREKPLSKSTLDALLRANNRERSGRSPSSLVWVRRRFTHLPAGRADWMLLVPPTINRCIDDVEF